MKVLIADNLPNMGVDILKKEAGIESFEELKFAAYLLVTYAIEVRALEFYPIYQQVLDKLESKVTVKSIISEEKRHLIEMEDQMKEFFDDWEKWRNVACSLEKSLYTGWLEKVQKLVG